MSSNSKFVPPISIDSLDGELKIELPKIGDVKNPILKKILSHLEELKKSDAITAHKSHHSHNKTSYDKMGWP